jgi:hypothetical protein
MLAKVVILLGAYWPTAHVISTALHATERSGGKER